MTNYSKTVSLLNIEIDFDLGKLYINETKIS